MKTISLTILALLAACGDNELPIEPGAAHQIDARPARTDAGSDAPSAAPTLWPCPFVCPGDELSPDGDHLRCVSSGETCAAEPACDASWTLADMLDCTPVPTLDGSGWKGRSNNCLDIKPRIGAASVQAIPCVSGPALPSCSSTCSGGEVVCDADVCWCTMPDHSSFDCVGAP